MRVLDKFLILIFVLIFSWDVIFSQDTVNFVNRTEIANIVFGDAEINVFENGKFFTGIKKYGTLIPNCSDSVGSFIYVYYVKGIKILAEEYFPNDKDLKLYVEFNEFGKHGRYIAYYKNGDIKYDMHFKNGTSYGGSVDYYPNGMINSIDIHDSIPFRAELYESGSIQKIIFPNVDSNTIKVSNGYMEIIFSESGKIRSTCIWAGGIQDYYEYHYSTTGVLAVKGKFIDVITNRIGPWHTYNDKGILIAEYNYITTDNKFKSGILDGESKFYDENGKLFQTKIYKNDVCIKVIDEK